MSINEVVRAWTDEDFRGQLTSDELARMPDHPVGSVDAEVDQLIGDFDPAGEVENSITTYSRRPCCY